MADTSLVPIQRYGFHLEEMEDESLLYNDKLNKTIYLNVSATVVWKLCDGTRSVKNIIDLLNEAYVETGIDVTSDVQAAIDELSEQRALRYESPTEIG